MATMLAAMLSLVVGVSSAPGWTGPSYFVYDSGAYAATFAAGHVYTAEPAPSGGYGPGSGPGVGYTSSAGTQFACCVPSQRYFFELSIAVHLVLGATWARIVWVDSNNRDAVWLSRNDTGQWVTSRLWIGKAYTPSVANLGRGIAVAFEDSHGRLRYLTWDPVSGPSAPITVSSDCCTGFSLAVNGGHPAIAFATRSYVLRLWTGGTTVTVAHNAESPSLAFAHGAPAIAYDSGGVWYAHRVGSTWHTARVLGLAYSEPSLAADASGRVALVAAGANATRTWIAFKRLDVASPTVTLMQAPYVGDAPESIPWDQPYVGLWGGKAVGTAFYAGRPATPGGGFPGPYVTRQL